MKNKMVVGAIVAAGIFVVNTVHASTLSNTAVPSITVEKQTALETDTLMSSPLGVVPAVPSAAGRMPLLLAQGAYATPPGNPVPPANYNIEQCKKWCKKWINSCNKAVNRIAKRIRDANPDRKLEINQLKNEVKAMRCTPDGNACKARCT